MEQQLNPPEPSTLDDLEEQPVLTESNIRQFRPNCKQFLVTAAVEIKARLPFQNRLLKSISWIQPASKPFIKHLEVIAAARCLPKADDLEQLQQEALAYLTFKLPESVTPECRVDHYWYAISKLTKPDNSPRFPLLSRLALTVLIVPHGNADSERLFSEMGLNKTKLRNRLGLQTLNALLCIKYNHAGRCFDFIPSSALLQRCRNAVKTAKQLHSAHPEPVDSD